MSKQRPVKAKLRAVDVDLNEMLLHTHRRWINERTPQAAAAFDKVLSVVFVKATGNAKSSEQP